MIELAGVAPRDVFVNYKCLKVMVRQRRKLCPVAVVGEDMDAFVFFSAPFWPHEGPLVQSCLTGQFPSTDCF